MGQPRRVLLACERRGLAGLTANGKLDIGAHAGEYAMSLELLSPLRFAIRLLRSLALAILLTAFSLLLGAIGYHVTASLGWLDSFLNASMILTGMGPLAELHTPAAKLFAMFYALYSGLFFVSVTAILVYPVMHRLLKRVHIEAAKPKASAQD